MSHIHRDPFLQLRFEMTNFCTGSDAIRQAVPLVRPPEAVAVLCKCEVGVGDDDPVSSIVPVHEVVQVLRFLALSDSECGECCVVESKLVYCQPS